MAEREEAKSKDARIDPPVKEGAGATRETTPPPKGSPLLVTKRGF